MTRYFIPDHVVQEETEEVWTGTYEEAFGSGQVSILNLLFDKWKYTKFMDKFGIQIDTDLIIPNLDRFKVK